MLGRGSLLALPKDITKFSDVCGLYRKGHWLNMGSGVLYFSFTRIRSVLHGFGFLIYAKYCFYPRINKVLIQ